MFKEHVGVKSFFSENTFLLSSDFGTLFFASRCRHWFMLFVLSVLANIYIGDFFVYYLLNEYGWDWIIVIGAVEATLFSVGVTGLSVMMVRLE